MPHAIHNGQAKEWLAARRSGAMGFGKKFCRKATCGSLSSREKLQTKHEGKNDFDFSMMRAETDKARLEAFMAALGNRVRGEGCVYLTGGAIPPCVSLIRWN